MSDRIEESDHQVDESIEDIFNILIATDIHLGYEENNPIRDQDTFDTFEEILKIAVKNEVDFILLGGDLFHDARPSPYALNKCLELLRKYCVGNKPISIEYLSEPTRNLQNNSTVNYEDPNMNISIPVFSIHGNHDDPTGHKHVSAIDLLASSGLLNYFGRWENYDNIEVEPILLKKGESKLALYGLSHIKDERLGRLFLDKKFKMLVPKDQDEWFHLLVWHQNRATRGAKNFIPDNTLPEFLDLVIWGHEHDCRIIPEPRVNGVYISQPGSSVATSLSAGEAITKHVGILKIYKRNFKMEPIELKTVRPFVYEDFVLKTYADLADENIRNLPPRELSMEIVKNKLDSMLEKAKNLGRIGKASEKPLIRLNIRCRDESQLISNTIRFGQVYYGKVANPDDIVKCSLIKDPVRNKGKHSESEKIQEKLVLAGRVEDMVTNYFAENNDLTLLSVKELNEAVKQFVDCNDTDLIVLVLEQTAQEFVKYAMESDVNPKDKKAVAECARNFKLSKEDQGLDSIIKKMDRSSHEKKSTDDDLEPMIINDDDEDSDIPSTSAAGKKGRGRGTRTSRATRGTRKPRARPEPLFPS